MYSYDLYALFALRTFMNGVLCSMRCLCFADCRAFGCIFIGFLPLHVVFIL